MSHQSYSSIGTSRRRGHLPIDRYTDVDRSVYTVGQTLASIVNDPRTAGQTSSVFWGLAHDASQPPTPPPLDPGKYPHVTRADLQKYISLVHEDYERFIRDRQSLETFDAHHQAEGHASGTQGEPFMAAVQAVPMQFFHENFFDEWDDFFKQYCQEQSADELYEQIDQLNKSLDVVELQLLREVASRSDSFFRAAASLQDLQGMLGSSVSNIRGLRRALAAADEQMCSTAGAVKALQSRKGNLQATLDITKGLEELLAAQQALDCLLESQDYAGALELLDQMKLLLEQPALLGLQCVRHLPPKLTDTTTAVEAALANEFLNTISNVELPGVVAQAASDAELQPDASVTPDGTDNACWQLPIAVAGTSSSTTAAAAEQLQDKLLPLAVGLYRCDRLGVTLQQYKVNVGDEVKAALRDAVQQVLPVLLSAEGEGSLTSTQQQAASEPQLFDQLQSLHHGAFMVLLHAAARVIYCCVDYVVRVGRLLESILEAAKTPASQLSPVRKDCSAAVQVVVDVALSRWVKLLSTRSAAHARLKQYELRQLLDLSEQVASHAESQGARIPGSFRTALQNHCKALLDHSHARHLNQLQHLLESEQWGPVEVPGSFQSIVDRMVIRCEEAAALLDGKSLTSAAAITIAASASVSSSTSREPSADGAAVAGSSAEPAGSEQHSPTLQLSGKSFHLVNSALMLLKMLDEYMSLYDLMPQFGAEIVHRELELLKLFNSQTAALVLGAGAMRTAGLRSISAKQLALSCQAVAMIATLLPLLRAGSLALVSQPRRALLMPEFDRLLQDLTLHVDEVHSKLVDIMKDRLTAAVQALPAEVRAAPSSSSQPSQSVVLLAKQLATLRSVLVPLLLKEEVEFIFGAVARAFSDGLSEVFELLMAQESACDSVVRSSALHMLQAFRDLSLDPARASNYSSRLSTTYTKHFGLPAWDQEKLGLMVEQQQQQQQQHGAPTNHQEHKEQEDGDQQQQQQQQSLPVSQQQSAPLQDISHHHGALLQSDGHQQQQPASSEQQQLPYDAGPVVDQQVRPTMAPAEQHTLQQHSDQQQQEQQPWADDQQHQGECDPQNTSDMQQADGHNMSTSPHHSSNPGKIGEQQQPADDDDEQVTVRSAGHSLSPDVTKLSLLQETEEEFQAHRSNGHHLMDEAAATSDPQPDSSLLPLQDDMQSPTAQSHQGVCMSQQQEHQQSQQKPEEQTSEDEQVCDTALLTSVSAASDLSSYATMQASNAFDTPRASKVQAAQEVQDTAAAAAFPPSGEMHTDGPGATDDGHTVQVQSFSNSLGSNADAQDKLQSAPSALDAGRAMEDAGVAVPAASNGFTATNNMDVIDSTAIAAPAQAAEAEAQATNDAVQAHGSNSSSLHAVMDETIAEDQHCKGAVQPLQQQQQGLQNGHAEVHQDLDSLLVDDLSATECRHSQETAVTVPLNPLDAVDMLVQAKTASSMAEGNWDPLNAASDPV